METFRIVKNFVPGTMVQHQRGWGPNDRKFYIVLGWKLRDAAVDLNEMPLDELRDCGLVLFPFGTGLIASFTYEEVKSVGHPRVGLTEVA